MGAPRPLAGRPSSREHALRVPGLPRRRDTAPGASGLPHKKHSPISGHRSRKNSTASVSPRAAALLSRAASGEPISINRLRQLSGQADVSALRARLLQRGLIAQQNGRYVRAETVNSARNMAPSEVKSAAPALVPGAAFDKAYNAIRQRAPTLRRQSLQISMARSNRDHRPITALTAPVVSLSILRRSRAAPR